MSGSERANFTVTQKHRWYRRINWNVHRAKYRNVFERVADTSVQQYWDYLYVEESVDDRWIMLRLGQHPVDLRGRRFTVEIGACLTITQQHDGSIVLALVPCRLDGEEAEHIFLASYDDPSFLTDAKLKRAVADFFRVVRVTSYAVTASRWDRIQVRKLRFSSNHPGFAKVAWAATSWPGYLLATALAIWGLQLSYEGLRAPKPPASIDAQDRGRPHERT